MPLSLNYLSLCSPTLSRSARLGQAGFGHHLPEAAFYETRGITFSGAGLGHSVMRLVVEPRNVSPQSSAGLAVRTTPARH